MRNLVVGSFGFGIFIISKEPIKCTIIILLLYFFFSELVREIHKFILCEFIPLKKKYLSTFYDIVLYVCQCFIVNDLSAI